MIDIQVRIHDKFSIEFKIGYYVNQTPKPDDFAVNIWFFVPNSLDINALTYPKAQFYRDLKSNVRLITPVFLLREIVGGTAVPFNNLKNSFKNLAYNPDKTAITEYEYEIKMFMAIFKSATRDEIDHILSAAHGPDTESMCMRYIENMESITDAYRSLRELVHVPTIPPDIFEYYMFGDEFMSSTLKTQTFRLLEGLCSKENPVPDETVEKLKKLILVETEYRKQRGFPITEPDSPTRNRQVVFRQGILKRYIESDLFISARKKRDGTAMEQIYLSIAAGVSMIFATAIAFAFQQKYGNFTIPLFVALVISYMLKDRIKELMRYWFAHKLKDRYFDNKIRISVKDEPIGWIKEGFDFISDGKVPDRVMEIRSRSTLLEAENRFDNEKIILFRRFIRIDSEMLRDEDRYAVAGINDIIRLHLTSFIQKMDNPEVSLNTIDEHGNITCTSAEKIYYLNMVIQLQHDGRIDYKRFRLVFNRNGILEIEGLR